MKAIDLFAGAGGFSTGAQMAGIDVVWAANHWPLAVKTHAANHPRAEHVCQDLSQANFTLCPPHDILLASPCCQGHSHARGKAANNPQHDASRATAWAVVEAAECHLPDAGVIENVPEFMDWALYPAWSAAWQALGYSLSPHIVDAADHGVPQHRERLFIIATRSKAPITLKLPKRDHVPASAVIDFASGNWSPIDKPGRAAATLARIANGRKTHGDRFIAPYYKSGSGLTGRSLHRPIGTITTKDRWSVVDGDRMRMATKEEYRAFMGFPSSYLLPKRKDEAVHLLGNAVCPPAVRDILLALKEAA